ncbi:MAG: alpha/beta hydrolase [Elusimicrobiales bacterium]|nr:alpha/beta hydrolase [Elusimicrobiales bacterium]
MGKKNLIVVSCAFLFGMILMFTAVRYNKEDGLPFKNIALLIGGYMSGKTDNENNFQNFKLDKSKLDFSRGTILLIHGSAPFNIDGMIPIATDSMYSKIPFYRDLSGFLTEYGWDVIRYSKYGVHTDDVDFQLYKNTDLKMTMNQLCELWKYLPSSKPRIIFAWSEGTLHALQMPLSDADAIVLLGGISTNIKDVIFAQADSKEAITEIEVQLKKLSGMKRNEMLGIDRPVGRLLDEFELKENWKNFETYSKLPILILHGEMDNEVPFEQSKIWQTKLPDHNITLKTKPSGNHMFGIEKSANTDDLAEVMHQWLIKVLKS